MALPYLGVPHLTILVYLPLLVLSLLCKLFFWIKFLYLQRGTLSPIPGPKWASWTRLWLVKTLASGRSASIFVEVNKRYGPLARVGPKHLLTNDPTLIRRILAVRSRYSRGPWFDSIRIDPHIPNIVSERDEKSHNRLRSKLSASYNSKTINPIEAVIDEQLVDWLRRVNLSWTSSTEKYSSFDIGKRIQFLTVDIITKICLGTALGCVASDSDKYDFLATVEQGNSICQHFSVILELNSMMYYLAKLPFLGSFVVPKATDRSGVGRIMGIVQAAVKARVETGTSGKTDMLSSYLEKGVPKHQVDAEVVIALVAGSDTTSTAVQSTLLSIILNPRVYQTLKSEIKAAVLARQASYPIRDSEAKQLCYLQACILEGLRRFPPLTQLRERTVPPEGDIIQGYRIPGGTFIGLNAWGTQLDAVYGEDPEVFRPERWLTTDKERLKAMHQTLELVFGHGYTKCLGMPMAMMELNKMIFELLRNFDITIADPYKPWSSVCYGIFFQKDFNVHLTRARYEEVSAS